MLINKITNGFVIQTFDTDKKQFVSQEFVGGGEGEYEHNGESIDIDGLECDIADLSFPSEMIQPTDTVSQGSQNFSEQIIELPKHDCDIVLQWPGGQRVTIQVRPSNADCGGYAGSLDIILPDNDAVTLWEGDNMQPALPVVNPGMVPIYSPSGVDLNIECTRNAKQIVTSMHDSWYGNEPLGG